MSHAKTMSACRHEECEKAGESAEGKMEKDSILLDWDLLTITFIQATKHSTTHTPYCG